MKKKNFIFRSSITRNGKTIYARDYGLKAFCIPLPDDEMKANNAGK